MKTTSGKEAFPSPLRLIFYLALIAAFCALNCLTVDAKIKPPPRGNAEQATEILIASTEAMVSSMNPFKQNP
jgi:hypothetical protein